MLVSKRPLMLDLTFWNFSAEENSTSYFPLLDRVSEGTFTELATEQELYEKFTKILLEDGHLQDREALSSFQFALAIHSAAPRIEAHFQYYQTSIAPSMMDGQDEACPVWVHLDDKQYCSPGLERFQQSIPFGNTDIELPFDRTLGDLTERSLILYADITSPLFAQFHQEARKRIKEGDFSYRLRYRGPVSKGPSRPLFLNGYGVELSLKRTDYIVIDDREATNRQSEDEDLDRHAADSEETIGDLRPLSTSELARLGLRASSYVMDSSDAFEDLVRIVQDFPRYSARVANHNVSENFLSEFQANRENFLPAGYNIVWMNGMQLDARQFNAFALVENLRRERALINSFKAVGFKAQEAVRLLSHSEIAQAQVENEPQRYDYRDSIEGGNVIMWLNDLKRDKRYAAWPSELNGYLQRTFPGQLPTVRRDLHNIVIPVDLSSKEDLRLVVDTLQNFVKRKIPARFGIVPSVETPDAILQAKVAYHLLDVYGLGALFAYLEECVSSKRYPSNASVAFSKAIEDRKLRKDQSPLAYDAILESHDFSVRVDSSLAYLSRLSAGGKVKTLFVNGIAVPKDENWLEAMSNRVSLDLRQIQRGIVESTFEEQMWLPDFFLFQSTARRNALICPEDPKNVETLDFGMLVQKCNMDVDQLLGIPANMDQPKSDQAYMLVIADFNTDEGSKLLHTADEFRDSDTTVELRFLHNPSENLSDSNYLVQLLAMEAKHNANQDRPSNSARDPGTIQTRCPSMMAELGLRSGEIGLVLNGRLVRGLSGSDWLKEDFDQLLKFERTQRLAPLASAAKALGFSHKFRSTLDWARISSLVARAFVSDVPEGIYESPPLIRIDKFDSWNGTYSSLQTSTLEDPTIRIVAAIDPTSEIAQVWLPTLKVLSELEGVSLQVFLNPRERLKELPIKRFYRQVLESAPSFDTEGKQIRPQARFTNVPAEALLNLGMIVPPSWLVAPKISVYDLDNIKMSSVPADKDIDAVYELEHILIEGHSRDMTTGSPPRGAQLLLGTEASPHHADTLIMANLGYFQFKANPGYWTISLKSGPSSKIFNIDSLGSDGWTPQPNDNSTSVALLSFQGKILYPRLSRKAGMEEEDVLAFGPRAGSAMDYISRGASLASNVLGLKTSKQADINIFSVASGHLYERMLNIMILSVLHHTTHSVKFWFIEQFLSPSFKSFLPHLAAHYKFDYEMVTYKWPHWLRGQKEKQREIWGYKILFLDVLFPLDLDKVIFVDADQIVRTDMMNLNKVNLHGAPYGFTPMCDSRTEMEGFRFWKTGYWANFLQGKPYHISALYVVDLRRFRELAAGDRLRGQYQALSADPASLSNLDQDLPNHMQHQLPIHSLSQEWLWCETWCSDETLKEARTIDLCNNPQTKEPKLERARRQVPEWNEYDAEIAELATKIREGIADNIDVEGIGVGSGEVQEQELRKKDEL
ncbi:MAG: hypothetical protein Q9227_005108 [Pyrenula ochraceoflavens]